MTKRDQIESATVALEESVRLLRQHVALYEETSGAVLALASFTLEATRKLARHKPDSPFRRAVPLADVLEMASNAGIKHLLRVTPSVERREMLIAIVGARAGWLTYMTRFVARAR